MKVNWENATYEIDVTQSTRLFYSRRGITLLELQRATKSHTGVLHSGGSSLTNDLAEFRHRLQREHKPNNGQVHSWPVINLLMELTLISDS